MMMMNETGGLASAMQMGGGGDMMSSMPMAMGEVA